jgi:hypothetical protein
MCLWTHTHTYTLRTGGACACAVPCVRAPAGRRHAARRRRPRGHLRLGPLPGSNLPARQQHCQQQQRQHCWRRQQQQQQQRHRGPRDGAARQQGSSRCWRRRQQQRARRRWRGRGQGAVKAAPAGARLAALLPHRLHRCGALCGVCDARALPAQAVLTGVRVCRGGGRLLGRGGMDGQHARCAHAHHAATHPARAHTHSHAHTRTHTHTHTRPTGQRVGGPLLCAQRLRCRVHRDRAGQVCRLAARVARVGLHGRARGGLLPALHPRAGVCACVGGRVSRVGGWGVRECVGEAGVGCSVGGAEGFQRT